MIIALRVRQRRRGIDPPAGARRPSSHARRARPDAASRSVSATCTASDTAGPAGMFVNVHVVQLSVSSAAPTFSGFGLWPQSMLGRV